MLISISYIFNAPECLNVISLGPTKHVSKRRPRLRGHFHTFMDLMHRDVRLFWFENHSKDDLYRMV